MRGDVRCVETSMATGAIFGVSRAARRSRHGWVCSCSPASPAERARYTAVKRELAPHRWRHMQNYADAKAAVVDEIVARAAGAEPAG